MAKNRVRLAYAGSKGWLIFWALVFFPIAMVLMLTAAEFELDQKTYGIRYDGSRGWLAFWTVAFYPVALILFLLNGFEVVVEEQAT
jgi:hypothetical protein